MADSTTVVEGKVKYREGKKWKSRWCVLKKPSPVADRLQLVLYKDVHEALRVGGRVKTSLALDGYFGVESGFTMERETNVLAIVCHKTVSLLAFDTRETLIQFEVKIRRSLGQEFQFPVRLVRVPSGSRLPLEGAKLLIHGVQFCLTAHAPPRLLQAWNVADLRRFGAVDGKFCFEGGSRCGKGAGVHAVQAEQAEEIAEILRVNSLGKSAAKPANNRSSQFLDYSLATAAPIWPQDSSTPRIDSAAVRPPILGCCQAVPGIVDGDEAGCRKRHSVSVTDFHRSGALTFQEKLRLMSIENVERQRLMAIYDVPPKHPRKLETIKSDGEPVKDTLSGATPSSSSFSSSPGFGTGSVGGELQTSQLTVKLQPCNGQLLVGEGRGTAIPQSGRVCITSVAGREYCIPRSLDTSIFDSIVNAQVDSTKRNEALQRLQKQESDLQEEIILLDQMLQGCQPDSQESAVAREALPHTQMMDADDPWEKRPSTVEPPLQTSTPPHVAKKAASLPPKISTRKEGSRDASSPQQAGSMKSASDNSVAALRERVGTGERSPLSPHLMSKLEKIPWYSQLNTPLPYVNLAKYDEETDSGHVYLAGSGGCDSGCQCHSPKLLRNPAGGSLASLRTKSGIASLPGRCFSETHIGPGASGQARRNIPFPDPLSMTHDEDGASFTLGDLSTSTDMLEDDAFGPPTTYAPPVPYPRPISTVAGVGESASVDTPPTTWAPPVPSATPTVAVSAPIREPIYINDLPPPLPPPRRKSDTPPPVLPPKGPALLRKTKQRSGLVPPAPPVRTRSLSVGSSKSGDYDNQASQTSTPISTSITLNSSNTSNSFGEDNYLSMGNLVAQCRERDYTVFAGRDSERPSSLYVTSSPKPRSRGSGLASRRGNAEVLSGYMDMANMFVDDTGVDEMGQVESELDQRDLRVAEPIQEAQDDMYVPADSNYMEMSNFPPPVPKRKSSVLKNLEALHTYVSTTPAGDAAGKPSPSPAPIPPPVTPSSTCSQQRTPPKTVKQHQESCLERGSIKLPARPAVPFTNLKSFEQKQMKTSSYVNTYIPAPEVPLPEPPKKEEGFFARLIRRNSKDKNASQSQENLHMSKKRTSVFERSMSEQVEEEEKVSTKVKVGRRRSASFPNRLSFQETAGANTSSTSPGKKETPPLPPPLSRTSDSTSVRTNETTPKRAHSARSHSFRHDQPSDTSSVNENLDDSDVAPLLRVGESGGTSEMHVLTVLHVQQQVMTSPPTASMPPYPFSNSTLFKCSGDSLKCSDDSLKCSSDSLKFSSDSVQKQSNSSCSLSDSSKTDDEKLMELIQSGRRQALMTDLGQQTLVTDTQQQWMSGKEQETMVRDTEQQTVILDMESIKSKLTLPLDKSTPSPKDQAAALARHLASVAPFIPPKTKKTQLSPVTEVRSPVAPPSSSPPAATPPSFPGIPTSLSAPNQDEAIYVDMKELLPLPPHGPASPTTASLHPYNCPREQKERARATLRITPVMEDEDGNIWVPRQDAAPGELRPLPLPARTPPPPLPGLSPRLPPGFASRLTSRPGDLASNILELRYTTPLVVSVDPLEDAGEGMADRVSLSSSAGSCLSIRSFDDTIIRSSPAATVLRPRSGRNYQVVERRVAGSCSASPSPLGHSPTDSNVFTYDLCSLTPKSASVSMTSLLTQDCEPSPQRPPTRTPSLSPRVFSLSKERTPPLSADNSLPRGVKDSSSSPPKLLRTCRRAQSEPCSSRADSPIVVISPYANSSPTSPDVPNAALLSPEMLEPMLNYAEIDLTCPLAPPPKQPSYSFRRHKKPPPKPAVIEYTQIDHTATNALVRAGREHAQAREGDSLRRTFSSLSRKNSTPLPSKDRKGSSTSFRDRKLSTCSIESV